MNQFRAEEIVTVQGREYVIIAGRLRVAHESNQRLSISTELVKFEITEFAVVKAVVTTEKGTYGATGVSSCSRDIRLAEALVELAETRAIARALRFAGFGLQVGVEEIGDSFVTGEQTPKAANVSLRVIGGTAANPDQAPKAPNRPPAALLSQAQRKCLYALSKRIGKEVADVVQAAYPGVSPDALSLVQASALIDRLKAKAGNGNGNGTGVNK